ncbi:MAG: ClpX C4-type zinc finger protein [Bacillota bacterium]
MADAAVRCSFCGRGEEEAWRLIAGPGVYICSDCVGVSVQILTAEPDGAGGFRVVSRGPDGTVQRGEHGPLPQVGPAEQGKHRWLRQCGGCGAWNVGLGFESCLECGGAL